MLVERLLDHFLTVLTGIDFPGLVQHRFRRKRQLWVPCQYFLVGDFFYESMTSLNDFCHLLQIRGRTLLKLL